MDSLQLKKILSITMHLYGVWVLFIQFYSKPLYNVIKYNVGLFHNLGLYAICVVIAVFATIYLAVYGFRNAFAISDTDRMWYLNDTNLVVLKRIRFFSALILALEIIAKIRIYITYQVFMGDSIALSLLPIIFPFIILVFSTIALRKANLVIRG